VTRSATNAASRCRRLLGAMLVSVLRPIGRLITGPRPPPKWPAYGFRWRVRAINRRLGERLPGMYRLKRTDGSLSDMVNLTRAKNALDDGLDVPEFLRRAPKGRRDMILANKKCPATKDRANLKDTRSAACTSATASAQQENAI
jgi:hypothetical protein